MLRRRPADHDRELGFPVDLLRIGRQFDRLLRPDHRMRRELQEEQRLDLGLVGRFAAGHLLHVVGVVGEGAEDRVGIKDRRLEAHRRERTRCCVQSVRATGDFVGDGAEHSLGLVPMRKDVLGRSSRKRRRLPGRFERGSHRDDLLADLDCRHGSPAVGIVQQCEVGHGSPHRCGQSQEQTSW